MDILIKPTKTRAEIAHEYHIDVRTLRAWLKEAGIELNHRLLTPNDQKRIYNHFGNPYSQDLNH